MKQLKYGPNSILKYALACLNWDLPPWTICSGSVACGLAPGDFSSFCLGMSFMNLRLTSFALEHALGNLIFDLAFAWELPLGIFRLGTVIWICFAWELLQLMIFSLASVAFG